MLTTKFLFIPVSSPKGIGEYIRCLNIAQEIRRHHPKSEIHFILSKETNYHKDCPFPVTLSPTSPTFHTDIVKRCANTFKPDVVLFDAAGRASQIHYCKKMGAKTIFICPRTKKLKKGLSLRRLLFTDYLWFVQPKYLMPGLNIWQRIKLKSLKKPDPVQIGPVFSALDQEAVKNVQKKYQLKSKNYIIVNAGGGGHSQNGIAIDTIFSEAAIVLSSRIPQKVVLIHGQNAKKYHNNNKNIIEIDQLSPGNFSALVSDASGAILAGGSVIFQAISYEINIVSAPITQEQKMRVKACRDLNLLTESKLSPEVIAEKMQYLLKKESKPTGYPDTNTSNGLDIATSEINKITGLESNTSSFK